MTIKNTALLFLFSWFPVMAEPVIIQRVIVTADIVVHENPTTKINLSTPIKTTINQTSLQSGSPLVTYQVYGGQDVLVSIPSDMEKSPSHCAHMQGMTAPSNKFKYCLDRNLNQKESIIYGKKYFTVPTNKPMNIIRKDTGNHIPIDNYLLTIDVISYFR